MKRNNRRTPYYYEVIRQSKEQSTRIRDPLMIQKAEMKARIKYLFKPPEIYTVSVSDVREELMKRLHQYHADFAKPEWSLSVINECLTKVISEYKFYESKK